MTDIDMKWPHYKTVFDGPGWNMQLVEFVALLDSVKDEGWWVSDSALKYINLRIDTRKNSFILYVNDNGEQTRIDPQRVADAINKYHNI